MEDEKRYLFGEFVLDTARDCLGIVVEPFERATPNSVESAKATGTIRRMF